jgi:hypothetical protein
MIIMVALMAKPATAAGESALLDVSEEVGIAILASLGVLLILFAPLPVSFIFPLLMGLDTKVKTS